MQQVQRKNRNVLFLLTLFIGVALFVGGCDVTPAESPKIYRIGVLSGVDAFNSATDGFQAGMAELGYIEGETLSYDFQSANGDRERMKAIAEQFVTDEVDLIFTTTTGAVQEVQAATATKATGAQIPVVFTIVSDPVGSGVVADLRQPGGNITGATFATAGLIGKSVALLHEIMPEFKGIWLPYEESYATVESTRKFTYEIADSLEITVIETPIASQEELITEINRLSALDELDFGAINISIDPIIQSAESIAAILAFAEEHNLPVMATTADQVRSGALLAYATDIFKAGQLAASLADEIFKGTEAGIIPVAFSEPNLYLNYKTAQALGLAIDDRILAQATEIIR